MRLTIDPWDPAYLAPGPEGAELARPEVLLDTETAPGAWRAMPGRASAPDDTVVVVDGVRRVEARVWLDDGTGTPVGGLCASWAAGAAACGPGRAAVVAASVVRGLVAAGISAPALATSAGVFGFHAANRPGLEGASITIQDRMADLEAEVSTLAVRDAAPGALVVLDGPLRERRHLPGAVGLVKTHRVAYLEGPAGQVLVGLGAGERTPVFTVVGRAPRHTWYLRLPGPPGGPMSGIVRLECDGSLGAESAVALAERTASALPRLASVPHKDPRAPQNLVPIAGLERELRRRHGDARVVLRALRHASAGAAPQRGLSPLR
ncbi:MAG: hypothetical protein ACKO91_07390 [Acidimicrobiales bacterium]